MTWYPDASRVLGPASKRLPGANPAAGVVCHSAEGYRAGLHAVLRETSGAKARTAWHFSVMQDGSVEQHYPITAVLGHCADWGGDADGVDGNGTLVGIEHEGVAGEPLTEAQRESSVALVGWIARERGWIPERRKTLWEHREISDTGTACPSDRIPWAYYTGLGKPPKATPFDWGAFYTNGATPVRVERRNPTTLAYVYEVRVYKKG